MERRPDIQYGAKVIMLIVIRERRQEQRYLWRGLCSALRLPVKVGEPPAVEEVPPHVAHGPCGRTRPCRRSALMAAVEEQREQREQRERRERREQQRRRPMRVSHMKRHTYASLY